MDHATQFTQALTAAKVAEFRRGDIVADEAGKTYVVRWQHGSAVCVRSLNPGSQWTLRAEHATLLTPVEEVPARVRPLLEKFAG